MTNNSSIYRIVLTGGPCGGKTTALSQILAHIRPLGFQVYLVPEAATLMLSGGISLGNFSSRQLMRFQDNLIKVVMTLEDAFIDIAHSNEKPAVIICDRGIMDVKAYLSPEGWTELLARNNWDVADLRERRYDAVIHLVTAADGAEEFYTTENNRARLETPEQARALDVRLRAGWEGHPNLCVVDNDSGFKEKIRRVVAAVCEVINMPEPIEMERKFLVRHAPTLDDIPVSCELFEIEQTYLLTNDDSEARVRRLSQSGTIDTYTHTTKRPLVAGQRVKVERRISNDEFINLLGQADPARKTIKKHRLLFRWHNHYFVLDSFIEPYPWLQVLEVDFDDDNVNIELPPFIEIEQEVTDDKRYLNYALAEGSLDD